MSSQPPDLTFQIMLAVMLVPQSCTTDDDFRIHYLCLWCPDARTCVFIQPLCNPARIGLRAYAASFEDTVQVCQHR